MISLVARLQVDRQPAINTSAAVAVTSGKRHTTTTLVWMTRFRRSTRFLGRRYCQTITSCDQTLQGWAWSSWHSAAHSETRTSSLQQVLQGVLRSLPCQECWFDRRTERSRGAEHEQLQQCVRACMCAHARTPAKTTLRRAISLQLVQALSCKEGCQGKEWQESSDSPLVAKQGSVIPLWSFSGTTARTSDTFTAERIVRELSENFSKSTLWSSCALLQQERATFNRAKKKNPSRTGVFQRYLYSTSFFLSRTLHLSFLFSSWGWWKKATTPISPEHASSSRGGRYGPESLKGTCTPFLSFFLELYTGLFFFHLRGGGQKTPTTPISPEHASSNRRGSYGRGSFKGICSLFLSFFLSELYTRHVSFLFSIDRLFYGTHSRTTYNHSRKVNHFAMLSRTTTNHINLPQQKTFTYHSPLPFLNLQIVCTHIPDCVTSHATIFLRRLDGDPLDQGSSLLGNPLNIINSILLSSRGKWTKKKPTTPYFTRSHFVQPSRTLRTRILQRYMYPFPSFFLY